MLGMTAFFARRPRILKQLPERAARRVLFSATMPR